MTCTTCGVDQTRPDDEHRCGSDAPATPAGRPNRPPLGWRALTLLVLGTTAAHTIATIVDIGILLTDYRFAKRFLTDPSSWSLADLTSLENRAETAGLVISGVLGAHVVTFVVWLYVVTPRVAVRYDGADKKTAAHWTFTAFWALVIAQLVFMISIYDIAPTDFSDLDRAMNAALDYDRLLIVSNLLEFPQTALILTGLYVVTRRMYELAAKQPPPPAPYVPSALGSRTLPRTVLQYGPRDAFWQEVTDVVARSGGPLPLLEVWADAPSARRWYLLTADPGDAAAVRARLSPWSGLTVYGHSPRTPDEAVLAELAVEVGRLREDPVAGGALGLIEEEGGRLRFAQLDSDDDLSSWLDQARSATRAGVYPVLAAADPAALVPG